jgi:glucose/arabinose dehydrogenase
MAAVPVIALLAMLVQAPAAHSQAGTATLAPGYSATVIATGLRLPTHIAYGPDGALYATELNGGENDGTGRIVRVNLDGQPPTPVLENLLKPVGLTFAGDRLYFTARERLYVSQMKDGKLSIPEDVFGEGLPFNGRSIGQVALGPDGNLYFQSTGNEGIPRDSGFIYSMKPGTKDRKIYARGFKNAYSFAWNVDTGMMLATEIGDGSIPGVGQPPEELNVVRLGGDYGWPQCYADQRENPLWGGNRNICADTDVPLALFPPQNTPTSVAFFDGAIIVSLFNGSPPRLVRVDPHNGTWADFGRVGQQPIALLSEQAGAAPATLTGALLVLDFADGSLTRVQKSP